MWLYFFDHSISITDHWSLITHHSIFHTRLASSPNFHHSIFFTLFVSPYLSAGAAFSHWRPNQWKKKEEKTQNWRSNKWKKKKSKSGQKLRLWVPPCVFIYKNAIELWVMEIENSQNVFSVSITHNSKIRELSDGNRVMKTELSFAK